jgi:hypothetical protein
MPKFGGGDSDYLIGTSLYFLYSFSSYTHRSYFPLLRLSATLVQRDTVLEQLLHIPF